MTASPGDPEVEALVLDRYLDSILARRPADIADVPVGVRAAARALGSDLPRFHPSFRFEDHLAMRLADAARASGSASGSPAVADALVGDALDGAVVTFPARVSPSSSGIRPVVIGSVLTSAAISLAGAAYVAWRHAHPSPQTTMARAVRAVARMRIA